jgi:hypothetical protein
MISVLSADSGSGRLPPSRAKETEDRMTKEEKKNLIKSLWKEYYGERDKHTILEEMAIEGVRVQADIAYQLTRITDALERIRDTGSREGRI